MKQNHLRSVFTGLIVLSAQWCFAAAATRPARVVESATEPKPRDEKWVARHEGFVKIAKEGSVDLLFLGDSITDGWRSRGKVIWNETFAPMRAANFGIGGDRTQHVLWRIQNGELEGIKPKLAVLMIGTNNLGGNGNEQIVAGITAIIREIQKRTPQTKILLLGIFPRAASADNPARGRIKAINEQIAKLDDGGKTIRYMDIGGKFLAEDGTLSKDIMPDFLHPNEKGYKIWADAIVGRVKEMMQ